MQYTFETLYNQKSLAVMAKCLRKTIRKKKSKRSHIFGWLVVVLAVLLSFVSGDEGFVIDLRTIITWTAGAAIVIALVFEDQINGYFARKNEKIGMIAETGKYFVFVFSENHAQVYDKFNAILSQLKFHVFDTSPYSR